METTVDGLENGHADVGKVGVVVEDEIASAGEVGSAEVGERVAPEAELSAQLLEGGDRDGADVAEGHVGTTGKVGEDNLERVQVTSEVDQTSGVGQVVDVDGLQVGVLGDVESADALERDTIQAGQTGVGDLDIASLGDTLGEVERLELREGGPGDGTDAAQVGQAEGGQGGQTVQLEGVTDRGKAGGGERGEVAGAIARESTGDLVGTVDAQVTREALADLNVTGELRASGVAVGIALAGDLDGAAAATTA